MMRTCVCGVVVAATLAAVMGLSAAEQKEGQTLVRHVVIFKFKESAQPADVAKIEQAFGQLATKVPGIVEFEWGTNNSPENLAQGFTHVFLVTFKDTQARDAYLPHPAHQEFVKLLRPHLDKAFVIDYTVQQ